MLRMTIEVLAANDGVQFTVGVVAEPGHEALIAQAALQALLPALAVSPGSCDRCARTGSCCSGTRPASLQAARTAQDRPATPPA